MHLNAPAGPNDGIVLHFGAVGVNVLNNYIHDYGFAGIRCGDYVSAQGDCMMTAVRGNYVYSPAANVMGDHDAAGIYYNTHWFNPGGWAAQGRDYGCIRILTCWEPRTQSPASNISIL